MSSTLPVDVFDEVFEHDGQPRAHAQALVAELERLGADSLVRSIYHDEPVIEERHRHRYEVNVNFRPCLEATGMRFSGMSPDGVLPEIIELPGHPWFVGVQYHPELKSKPFAPHPLFASFIAAAVRQARLV